MEKSNQYNELLAKYNSVVAQNSLLQEKISALDRYSNDVYKRVFINSNDIISLVDKNYKFISVNTAFLKNHNISKDEVFGKSIVDIIGDQNFENIVKSRIDRCLTGESVSFQEWFESAENDSKFLDINYSPFWNEKKQIRGVLISARDITTTKHTEIKLSELSAIVEQSNEAIIRADSSFKINYMNKAAENLYGWKFDEIKQKNPLFLVAEKNISALKRNVVFNLKKNGNISSVSLNKTKTGQVFYCEFKLTVIYNVNKKITGYVAFVRDITESKVAEQKIKHEREYLQNLFSSMRDLVFVFDKNGKFVDYNRPNYEQELFAEPKYFLNKHYSKVMPKNVSDKIDKTIDELKNGKDVAGFDYSLETNDKIEFFNVLYSKLVDNLGNYKGAIAIVRNVTEQKVAQQKLELSEQKFKTLVNNSPDIIYRYSPQKGTLFCSSRVYDILGYKVQELYDNPFLWTNSILDEYKPIVIEAIEKYKPGEKNEIIYQIADKNGDIKWFSDVFTYKIVDDEQTIIEGHASDITDYKNAELEIVERQNFIKSILDNMPSAVFVHDISGKFIIVNKKAEQNLGYSKNELLSMNVNDIDVDNDSEKHINIIWEKLKKLKSINFETNHLRKDKTIYPVEMFVSSVIIKKQKYLLCIANDITERKNAENKLFENEQKLETILNSFRDPVYIVNRNCDIEYLNDALKNKISVTNRANLKCYNVLYNRNLKCDDCLFDDLNDQNNLISVDLYHEKWKEYHNVTNILLLDQKKLTIHFDITERKKTEKALKQSEQQHKFYGEFLSNVITISNVEEIYDFVSISLNKMFPELITIFSSVNQNKLTSKIENIVGVNQLILNKVDEIAGFKLIGAEFPIFDYNIDIFYSGKLVIFNDGLVEFSNPQFTPEAIKKIEDLLGVNKVYAIGLTFEKKLYAIIRFLALNDFEIKNLLFIETLVKQIGIVIERKIYEKQLIQSEEKYRLTVNNLPDVIITFKKGKLLSISPSFFQILGFDENDFKDASIQNFIDLIHDDDRDRIIKEYYKSLLKKETFNTYEYRIRNKKGGYHWTEQRVSRQFDENGDLRLTVVSARNIDQRKQDEKELNELVATKDKFFNLIAHDLRSPFNSILGFSNILKNKIEVIKDEELSTCVDSLHESAQNSYNLVENLLTWAQSQTGKLEYLPEKHNLYSIINIAKKYLIANAEMKNISMTVNVDKLINVFVDFNMIITVFRNLISNAIKYTNNNGHILISAKTNNKFAFVSVSDNGVGIEPERINNLFKIDKNTSTYGTNDEMGTGLGLILCKEFVEKHGGKVWVNSELNKGSEFIFSIPFLL